MQQIDAQKIGIHGFGRKGRLCLRICLKRHDAIQVMLINDPMMSLANMVYLFKHDSTYGEYPHEVKSENNNLIITINDKKTEIKIPVSHEKDIKAIKWKKDENERVYVIESTGTLTSYLNAHQLIDGGAFKVIITAPTIDVPMFVFGVNHTYYNPTTNQIISSSCSTTHCAATMLKILNDEYKIEEALVTSIHAATTELNVQDSPAHMNPNTSLRRQSRSILQNIIPCMTGANRGIAAVIPELKCRVGAIAYKIPIHNVSLCEMHIKLIRESTYDEVKQFFKTASEGALKNLLAYTDEDVVSSDFRQSTYSCIFDSKTSFALNSSFMKIVAWYDNEYGYACRVIDLIQYMHEVAAGAAAAQPVEQN